MKNILSIDMDYFFRFMFRNTEFPDPIDISSVELSSIVWGNYYRSSNSINLKKAVEFMDDEFEKTLQLVWQNIHLPYMISESHIDIYDFVSSLVKVHGWDQCRLVNVDYHHDIFGDFDPDKKVSCGNWVHYLFAENLINEYVWVGQDTSEGKGKSIINERPVIHAPNVNMLIDYEYDAVFICRSLQWFPPHLDIKWINLIQPILEIRDPDGIDKYKGLLTNRMVEIERSGHFNMQPCNQD